MKLLLLIILQFADTICGATGAPALTAADFVGPDALAAGTYANFDHIVIPGGKEKIKGVGSKEVTNKCEREDDSGSPPLLVVEDRYFVF